ncbi:hypothetical protein LC605_30095 [Nostoc sp. CHAB 5836]|uniref:hypothetical protein n=1 Tax=Nostoc sp. CHAB 5836 TaxID=2780404 RepID=UPI001E5ADAD1|nr:hypothetical protein [Nostoc sp. CHAB 5836]MCC5619249.1 hypothetical protein [Nostoc sp. CHAB 5836]
MSNRYDWSKFQKLIRRVHNLYVNSDIKKETKKTKKSLLEYALIDTKDTAFLVITKQIYYWFTLGYIQNRINALAVVPEWWAVRKGADRPQLVILFKSEGNKSNYYTLHIPHYDGRKSSTCPISTYTKGNYRGCLTLRDNSKFICYASSEREAESVINDAKKHIIEKFLLGSTITIGTTQKKNFKTDKVKPVSGKFFSSGSLKSNPDWIVYY